MKKKSNSVAKTQGRVHATKKSPISQKLSSSHTSLGFCEVSTDELAASHNPAYYYLVK